MNFSKQLIMEIGIDNCRHLADLVVGFGISCHFLKTLVEYSF